MAIVKLYHMTNIDCARKIIDDGHRNLTTVSSDGAMKFLSHQDTADNTNYYARYGCLMTFDYEGDVINGVFSGPSEQSAGKMFFNGSIYLLCPTHEKKQVGLTFDAAFILDYQRDINDVKTTSFFQKHFVFPRTRKYFARQHRRPIFVLI